MLVMKEKKRKGRWCEGMKLTSRSDTDDFFATEPATQDLIPSRRTQMVEADQAVLGVVSAARKKIVRLW